jgi:16S rRNA (guanine1207-N2)-methyltransferase
VKHYFIADPVLSQRKHLLEFTLYNQLFRFNTCDGLFSYEKPDAASLLLLETLHNTVPPFKGELLDLGCGYGLIGIVLAKAHTSPAASLTFSDINEIACAFTAQNTAANTINAEIIHSDGFKQINKTFDHIFLNPPIHTGKDTIYRLYNESTEHLHPGGSLYLVIQKKHGAESTLAYLSTIFHQVKILYKRKGYLVIQNIVKD